MSILPIKVIKRNKLEELEKKVIILESQISAANQFIKEIEKGNISAEYQENIASDNSIDDTIATSLKSMRDQIKKMSDEERQRNWITEGLAKFVDILRSENNDTKSFSESVIRNLVKYMNANQGSLYIINDDTAGDEHLELQACYAFDKRKHLTQRIEIGAGITGQAVLEKSTIYMTNIPDDYIRITSGLGDALPRNLLIVPLSINEKVYGVVEMASFYFFEKYQIEFIEKLGESIASTISTVKINQRTQKLLIDSQIQTEQMKSQEEEMRQNLEELQATQEEINRKNTDIQNRIEAINNSGIASIEFDIDKNILTANRAFLNLFEYQLDEITGLKHSIFLQPGEAGTDEYKKMWDDFSRGIVKQGEFKRVTKSGKEVIIQGAYSLILGTNGKPEKVLKLASDITESKVLLYEVQQQTEQMKAQEEELRQNMEELSATQEEMQRILQEVQLKERYTSELLSASKDTILSIDKDYRLFDFNSNFKLSIEATGGKVEKGDSILDFVLPEERQKNKEVYDKAFNGEAFEHTEHLESSDTYYFSSYTPLKNPEGQIYAVAVFAKDITDMMRAKKKAELLLQESQEQAEQMRAQEEELRQNMEELSATQDEMQRVLNEAQAKAKHSTELIGASQDTIFAIDKDYKLVEFNDKFKNSLETLGFKIEKGTDVFLVLSPEERPKHKALYDRVFNGEAFEVTEHIKAADAYYLSTYSPLRNENGEIYAAVIFAKDVTELAQAKKQMQLILEEKNLQLKEIQKKDKENLQMKEELNKSKLEKQAQEKYLSELLNGTSNPIYSVDKEYRLLNFNEAFKQTLKGVGVEVEKGANLLSTLKDPKEQEDFRIHMKSVFKGESLELVQKISHKKGTSYILLNYHPVRNLIGEIVAATVYITNVTELISSDNLKDKFKLATNGKSES